MEKNEFILNNGSEFYTVGRSQRGKPQVIYKGQTYSIHYTRTKRQSRLVCGCTRSIIGMKRCCPAYIIISTSPNGEENVSEKRNHMCNASVMPDEQRYTVATTNKNKPSILHQGYTYALMYKTDIAAVYLCTKPKKNRKLRCKARCIINTINGIERLRLENTHECQKRSDTHRYEDTINTVAKNIQQPYTEYKAKVEVAQNVNYDSTIPNSGAIIHIDEASAEGFYEEAIFVYGQNNSLLLLKDGYRFTKSSRNRTKKITIYRCSYKENDRYVCKCIAHTKLFGNKMMVKLRDGTKNYHSHPLPDPSM